MSALKRISWRDYAVIRLMDYMDNGGKSFKDPNRKNKRIINHPIKNLWLAIHSGSAVLLRVLGKISIKCLQMEKAEQYLSKSIGIEPTVAAFQLLGDVLIEKGDTNKASDCYRKGLELASSEIVNRVEGISE